MAFLHGHETAVHQLGDRPMLDMIRDANKSKYGYVPLNNYWQCVNLHKNEVNSYLSTSFDKFNLDIKTFITCGGAQFIVSKDRIFRHTKDEYKILLDKIITKDDAVCMELIWHNIFGENINLIPRDDHFEPPLKEIRYSHASNIPMRVCEVGFIYIGKKYFNRDYKKYQNKAKTFFIFEGDFKIYDPEILEEVLVVKYENKLEGFKKYVRDRALLFEKLYLEEYSAI